MTVRETDPLFIIRKMKNKLGNKNKTKGKKRSFCIAGMDGDYRPESLFSVLIFHGGSILKLM